MLVSYHGSSWVKLCSKRMDFRFGGLVFLLDFPIFGCFINLKFALLLFSIKILVCLSIMLAVLI